GRRRRPLGSDAADRPGAPPRRRQRRCRCQYQYQRHCRRWYLRTLQRFFEGCLGLLEDLGRLDRYAPALALALRGKIGRPGDAVTLRDYAGVLVGAGAFAHALANCLALGGVDGACETEPEVRIARRGLDDDRGLRCRRPCPALVAVAVDDERKDPE